MRDISKPGTLHNQSHGSLTIIIIIIIIIIFAGFPARTVKIREHQQLQQKISKLSVMVASQMAITSYHFDRFQVP